MGTITETFRNTALDALPNIQYLALFVGDPEGAGLECTGTGYERISVTMGAASIGQRANTSGSHVFTVGAGGWQAGVSHGALYTALIGGNRVSSDPLSTARDMSIAGATMTFGVGDITQTIT